MAAPEKITGPNPFHTDRRTIMIPLADRSMLEVPTIPLFTSILPRVTSMFGADINRDTTTRIRESVVVAQIQEPRNRDAYAVRVSDTGTLGHFRSINYAYPFETLPERIEIEGRTYSGISSKGADFANPRLTYDDTYPEKFRIEGLITREYAKSIVEASNWLRSVGISSEVVWSVSLLNNLPIPKEWNPLFKPVSASDFVDVVPPKKFKRHLIKTAREYNATAEPDKQIDIEKARRYLSKAEFVVINRATTVPFRLSDLAVPFSSGTKQHQFEEFTFMMNRILHYLNSQRTPENQFNLLTNVNKYPSTKTGQIWDRTLSDYFDYVATNLGTQVGSLHKYNVAHTWLHTGNIVADGSFCDLDSMHGLPLKDPAITIEDVARDIYFSIGSLYDITDDLYRTYGVLYKSVTDETVRAYLRQYIKTRWKQPPQKWEPEHTPEEVKQATLKYLHEQLPESDYDLFKAKVTAFLDEFDHAS